MLYQYQPLNHKDIRLLVLEPASSVDDVVSCSLSHHPLQDEPTYEAVSYVWGDPHDLLSVSCADQEIKVTVNMHMALRYLRQKDKPRILWADAICIDQKNLEERSQQVRLMAKIYQQAERVLVWLGEETEDVKSSFDTIRNAWSVLPTTDLGRYKEPNIQQVVADHTIKLVKEGKPTLYDNDWRPLVSLLRRPWFQRKWVIQEIAYAQRAVIMCGNLSQDWAELGDLLYCIEASGFVASFSTALVTNGAPEPCVALLNLMTMSYLHCRDLEHGSGLPLHELLVATRDFNCLDPRDHVIAILSLAQDVNLADKAIALNYEACVEEYFEKITIWSLVKQESLALLSLVSRSYDSATHLLPTWVPDFGQLGRSVPLTAGEDAHFCACGDSRNPGAYLSHDNKALHLTGIVVDKIRVLARNLNDIPLGTIDGVENSTDDLGDLKIMRSRTWVEECRALLHDPSLSLSTEDIKEAFWRTMLCDRIDEGQRPPAEYSSYFSDYLEFLDLMQDRNYDGWSESFLLPIESVEASIAISASRRFCISDGGRMGQMPRGAEIGDLICVLNGGRVPFVLRETGDDKFGFVGECYVHGIMHGEAMEGNNDLKREFTIL